MYIPCYFPKASLGTDNHINLLFNICTYMSATSKYKTTSSIRKVKARSTFLQNNKSKEWNKKTKPYSLLYIHIKPTSSTKSEADQTLCATNNSSSKVWSRTNFLLIPISILQIRHRKKKKADNIQSPKNTNHVISKAWSKSNFLFITNQKKER